jgi:galactofuranosylgalactofuranosylrhamnosyl-N-acetylglucosaminyl-diphospho-decaprenol beta-1,5/1,6-galactofuranosyltransferase
MELFKICFPRFNNKKDNLYLRVRSGTLNYENGVCILSPNSEVSTDTYFNIFSSSKYSKYTSVRKVSVTTFVSGKLDVELRSVSESGEKIIETKSIDSENKKEVTFCFNICNLDDNNPVCHYLLYRSYNNSVIESLGSYISETKPNDVNMGIVICTFKREKRLIGNVNNINRFLSEEGSSISDNITVYVIDNGSSLNKESIESNFVKLITYRNEGGSGGFTRGILECRRDCKSHILLMDDDIDIDPNVIYKTFRFVSVLNNNYPDTFVLGGMLLPDNPYIQFEAGAQYIKKFKRGKHMLDLRDVGNLILNDKWEHADYGGWWYVCMPASATNELPLPLFIKLDDVEYGIRRMRSHVIMNGIGVWHDSFESKTNPVIDYYFLKRNRLIVWALYGMKNRFTVVIDYMRNMMHCLKKKKYEELFYTGRAVEDFMIGPDLIKNATQADLLNNIKNEKAGQFPNNKNLDEVILKKQTFRTLLYIFLQGTSLFTKWNKLRKQYCMESEYLSSYEFWKKKQ